MSCKKGTCNCGPMKKTLYVLNIGNYRPELLQYTLPTIKLWAKKNGWEYQEITENYFPDLPITANKLKIYDFCENDDWTCNCDADIMLRPDLFDLTKAVPKMMVFASYGFNASDRFETKDNLYFLRDGRDRGLSGGFIINSKWTRELREYPRTQGGWDKVLKATEENPHLIDEFVVAENLAKYGLKYDGIAEQVDNFIVHFGSELVENGEDKGVVKAKELFENWSVLWPELSKFAQNAK